MDCLDGIVGLKCSATGADEGALFYLSELPGIDLAGAAQVANSEQVTGEAMLRESISFSQKIVAQDFAQRLTARGLQIRELIDQDIIGRHSDTFQDPGTGLVGIRLRRQDTYDRYIRGYVEYLEVRVSAAASDVPYQLEIDGCAAEDFTADLTCGVNRIRIDRFFRSEAIIAIDATDLEISDGAGSSSLYRGDCCSGPCLCCGECLYADGVIDSGGAWASRGTFGGLVVSAACRGSIEEVVCRFRQELATALLYRAGAHVMESVMASSRPNPYVRNTKDEAMNLYTRWMGGVNTISGFSQKGEYEKHLEQVVEVAFQNLRTDSSRAFANSVYQAADTVRPLYNPRYDLMRRSLNKNRNTYGM